MIHFKFVGIKDMHNIYYLGLSGERSLPFELLVLILSSPGAGAFSGGFTTNLARQCRAFSRGLKIEKLKAPLFRGPEGPGLQMTGALFISSHHPRFRLYVALYIRTRKSALRGTYTPG